MLAPLERKILYGLLATLFTFPDEETLSILSGIDGKGLQSIFPELPAPPAAEGLEELRVAYTELFGNHRDGVTAPLYGSAYLDEDSRVMGESSLAVRRAFAAAGLSAEGSGEPPDFLPGELEFLFHLAEKEEQAASAGEEEVLQKTRTAQSDFLLDLLHPWIAPFCGRVLAEEGAHPTYRWSALLLQSFCDGEKLMFENGI